MTAIEIARQLAALGQSEKAVAAYGVAVHEAGGNAPAIQLEGAVYILQNGGDYKVSYLAEKFQLHRTGGSDFHGEKVKPDVELAALHLELDWLLEN